MFIQMNRTQITQMAMISSDFIVAKKNAPAGALVQIKGL